jgi:hypothetical protein
MRLVCLRILAFSVSLLVIAGARAGAWLELPAQGEVILGGSFSDSLRASDANGRLAPVSSYKKIRADRLLKLYQHEEWIFSAQTTLREATNARSRIFSIPAMECRPMPGS